MPLSMPVKDTSKTSMNKLGEKRSTTRSRGRNMRAGTNAFSLDKGYKQLYKSGNTKISNNNISDNDLSIQIMDSMGCVICSESKDFSIITAQTDSEIIDNENLINIEEYKAITNEMALATNVFVNNTDPFFTIDDSPPATITAQNKQIVSMESSNIEQLTADIINFKYSSEGTTTKYFK